MRNGDPSFIGADPNHRGKMAMPKIPPNRGGRTPPQPPDKNGGPRHNSHGREHQVHQEILDRRMRGGPELTPEAYERARDEWKNLQGSVMRPPTDVKVPTANNPSEKDQDQKPKSDSNDK
jgi:hypothetical protein